MPQCLFFATFLNILICTCRWSYFLVTCAGFSCFSNVNGVILRSFATVALRFAREEVFAAKILRFFARGSSLLLTTLRLQGCFSADSAQYSLPMSTCSLHHEPQEELPCEDQGSIAFATRDVTTVCFIWDVVSWHNALL